MLLWCSDNTQSFVHDESGSISQFINGKSRDLQKILRYLDGIANSTFKAGTGGCGGCGGGGGWDSFRFGGGCCGCSGRGGISGVFPTIFDYI